MMSNQQTISMSAKAIEHGVAWWPLGGLDKRAIEAFRLVPDNSNLLNCAPFGFCFGGSGRVPRVIVICINIVSNIGGQSPGVLGTLLEVEPPSANQESRRRVVTPRIAGLVCAAMAPEVQ